jgi:hypothetical protein
VTSAAPANDQRSIPPEPYVAPVTSPDLERPATLADLRMFEARFFGDPRRPAPPHDLEAEYSIVERLLGGHLRSGDLDGLRGQDFFLEDLGWIVDAGAAALELGVTVTVPLVAEVLRREGFRGGLEARLEAILDDYPATSLRRVPELVKRVRSLARLRRALEAVLRAEESIRIDADPETTVEQLYVAIAHLQGVNR